MFSFEAVPLLSSIMPCAPPSQTPLVTCLHPLYAEAASEFTQRQLWGLVVRHERAIRAISPRSSSSSSSSGVCSSDTVQQLFHSVGWLSPVVEARAEASGAAATVALLRILTSFAASSLKTGAHHSLDYRAARNTAILQVLRCWGSCWLALCPERGEARPAGEQAAEAAARASVPAVICLLLPRLAASSPAGSTAARAIHALSYLLTNCLKCDPDLSLGLLTSCYAMKLVHGSLLVVTGVSACTVSSSSSKHSSYTCQDIGWMGDFACAVAYLAHRLVTEGCSGAPVGSAQLRSLLARPLLQLLRSPLLDLLARLQHVPVDASAAAVLPSGFSLPCGPSPLHQMLETMQSDADDAKLAMQASGFRV